MQRKYKIDGVPYCTATAAARIAEIVPESTVRRWVNRGWTSFGLSLDIVVKNDRPFVCEWDALAIKEFLQDHPRPRPGASLEERDEFRRAASEWSHVGPRSWYSLVRKPMPKSPHL
jgi:hypothetical protein